MVAQSCIFLMKSIHSSIRFHSSFFRILFSMLPLSLVSEAMVIAMTIKNGPLLKPWKFCRQIGIKTSSKNSVISFLNTWLRRSAKNGQQMKSMWFTSLLQVSSINPKTFNKFRHPQASHYTTLITIPNTRQVQTQSPYTRPMFGAGWTQGAQRQNAQAPLAPSAAFLFCLYMC